MLLNKLQLMKDVDTQYLLEVLTSSLKIIKEGVLVLDLMENYTKDEGANYQPNVDGYGVLSSIEEVIDLDYSSINKFYLSNATGHADLVRRQRDFLDGFTRFLDASNSLLDLYVPPTYVELVELEKLLKSSIGHLCVFVRKQFEFDNLEVSDKVDFVLQTYLDNNGISLEDALKIDVFLLSKIVQYRPKIAVFDKYPEYEVRFFDLVGEEFYDMEYLDIAKVLDIINEKITPEELLEEINSAKE